MYLCNVINSNNLYFILNTSAPHIVFRNGLNMFNNVTRLLLPHSAYASIATRVYCHNTAFVRRSNSVNQVDYINSVNDSNAQSQDWETVKNNVLSMHGNLNPKNADAVILRILVGSKNLNAASLFAQHLKSRQEELSLGFTNSILLLYTALHKENKLPKEEHTAILNIYENLYEKYKILDSSTCEQLLHALCAISDWEKAIKVLNDIHVSSVPTHSAFSTLIGTLFRLNKKKKALELVEESIKYKRPLQHIAYEEWFKYILRKYKDKKIIAKHLEVVFNHIGDNWAVISEKTARQLKDIYVGLDWDAHFARIKKTDGQCSNCKDLLDCLTLSDEEFNTLQTNVKDKLIIGSDILLKTTHDELDRFLKFIDKFAPFDVVLDGLNISYVLSKSIHSDKIQFLDQVVNHFCGQNKRILLLGRQHMLRWNKKAMERIMRKTCAFFTENLSQDDPFFITAAILSGSHADIVSKDLLRSHLFNLKDESLRRLFRRWQWQHQWMIHMNYQGKPIIQARIQTLKKVVGMASRKSANLSRNMNSLVIDILHYYKVIAYKINDAFTKIVV